MTGFSGISDVAAAAPEVPGSGDMTTPVKTRGKSAAGGAKTRRLTTEELKEQEKEKLVEEALSKVGGEMMKALAALPYEAWAVFFSDPALQLDKTQQQTLAESYLLIAKAIKPDQVADWRVLVLFAMLQNGKIVMQKVRERKERQKQQMLMEGSKDELPQVSM